MGQMRSANAPPKPGDIVVFFYAPRDAEDPGFYGWAIVTEWYDNRGWREIYFRPVSPSDSLKMRPWWDDQARALAVRIRGKMTRATLWGMPANVAKELRNGLMGWATGVSPRSETPN